MTKRANGEGSVRHRSDGRWEVRWSTIERGRYTRHSAYAPKRQDALRLLRSALSSRDAGRVLRAGRETVGDFLRAWLDGAAPSVRPPTARRYREVIEGYIAPSIGHCRLTDLEPDHVSALYVELIARGLAPKTVQLTHTVLRRALTQAVRWDRLPRNVATLVDPPRVPKREAATLMPSDLARLREALRGHRLEALFLLAMLTGLRRGELLALRWDAVDFEHCALDVRATMQRMPGGPIRSEPKSPASRRTIALGAVALSSVQAHRVKQLEERLRAANVWDPKGDGYVFTSEVGHPLAPTTLARAWSALLARAELQPVPFHSLRHAAATLSVAANVPPKVTARRLGHATAAITLDRYSHVTDELERAAAQAIEATLRQAEVSARAQLTQEGSAESA